VASRRNIISKLEVNGSNLVGTNDNTFSLTTVAMAGYEMEAHPYELNIFVRGWRVRRATR
jgi:methionine synthase I (cobalamin-dependent)